MITGMIFGVLIGYAIWGRACDCGDNKVNQSGNIAGGDIVGRDKSA